MILNGQPNCPECGALARVTSPRTAVIVALAIVAFFVLLLYGLPG